MVDKKLAVEKLKEVINLSSEKMSIKETHNCFLPNQDSMQSFGEEAVWKAVITQALMDAGSNNIKPELKKEKAYAISWLNGDSDDFYEVCIMANLDPSYVKEQAKEAIKRGCTWRKESKQLVKKKQEKIDRIKVNIQAKDLEASALDKSSEIIGFPEFLERKSLFKLCGAD